MSDNLQALVRFQIISTNESKVKTMRCNQTTGAVEAVDVRQPAGRIIGEHYSQFTTDKHTQTLKRKYPGVQFTVITTLLNAEWVIMDDSNMKAVELWKPHPGGPPSPAVIVGQDGKLSGESGDVFRARCDIESNTKSSVSEPDAGEE